jgi:hypothetical protein
MQNAENTAGVTKEKPQTKMVVLEEKPDKGRTPLKHVSILRDAKEWGDHVPQKGDMPQITAMVREGLKAYATNVSLIKKFRSLNGSDPSFFSDIVRDALQIAIRLKIFEKKKQTTKQ